jgi:hypothetical protein
VGRGEVARLDRLGAEDGDRVGRLEGGLERPRVVPGRLALRDEADDVDRLDRKPIVRPTRTAGMKRT